MKPQPTQEQQINQAVSDIKEALLENISASQAETDAKFRKKKAYNTLLKAKERLRGIEQDLMCGMICE